MKKKQNFGLLLKEKQSCTPGTFVRLDPSTYPTDRYGQVQISYVLPSGQLQRVSTAQARAMGWNGNLGGEHLLLSEGKQSSR